MGKEEIARYKQFLLFLQGFLLNQMIVSPFVHILEIIYLFAAELEELKIGISGKGLRFLLQRVVIGVMHRSELSREKFLCLTH